LKDRDPRIGDGEWLFRNRSWIPLIPLAALLASIPLSQAPAAGRAWELACVLVSMAGVGVRALAIGTKPRSTSGRNRTCQVAESLNTTGLYSVVRHPLYLGNALMWTGVALFPRVWPAALFSALFFALFYGAIMQAEDAFLRERFGEEHRDWAERTPALLPAFWRWRTAALPFSLRAVLKAEYPGFLALAVLFWVERSELDLVHLNRFVPRPYFLALLLSGVLAYTVLRTLRRHTTLLRTPGR
jgi:protein-S-isoprenylcysteine O-methyltransferase Ste14